MRVAKRLAGTLLLAGLAVAMTGPVPWAQADSNKGLSPEETVRSYLSALQGSRFAEAYDYVSSAMTRGKDREVWAKEYQYIVQLSEIKIFDFKVFPAVIVGDKARVPNILKSQDKYLNQLGLDEYEIYELIRENDSWRIDQQTLVQGGEREEYFRDPPAPEAKSIDNTSKGL